MPALTRAQQLLQPMINGTMQLPAVTMPKVVIPGVKNPFDPDDQLVPEETLGDQAVAGTGGPAQGVQFNPWQYGSPAPGAIVNVPPPLNGPQWQRFAQLNPGIADQVPAHRRHGAYGYQPYRKPDGTVGRNYNVTSPFEAQQQSNWLSKVLAGGSDFNPVTYPGNPWGNR